MSDWVDAKKWSEIWEKIKPLGSGGQGDVLKVRRLSDDRIACLKILSKQNEKERRARFFREAVAYQTCNHELVPSLVQTNANHADDLNYKLYIATEFIEGSTLAKFVETNGALAFTDAVKMTKRLLGALNHLHKEGWVHRDIKPDNIILRNDDLDWPILLDFGLSHRDGISASFETELGQEVGNRFLRLPELGIGSGNKQDPRSDLAFAGGILFFAITAELPAMLQDADGRMPHQRQSQSDTIKNAAGNGTMALLDWFDRALNPIPQRRFIDAKEMADALDHIVALRSEPATPKNGNLNFVFDYINRQATKEQEEKAKVCASAMQTIQDIHTRLATSLHPTFVSMQTNYARTPQGIINTLGFAKASNSEQPFWAKFTIEIIGGEVVIQVDRETLYRTDATAPEYAENFSSLVEQVFSNGLRELIDDPLSQVASHGHFKSKPFMTLVDAKANSLQSGKPIFVVIFDDEHPKMSKLNYTLGYFMEYQTTKDLVDHNFEVALVGAAAGREAGLVPSSDPLEKPRWVVLAPDGSVLANEGLYANPDEGLLRVRDVLARWSTSKAPTKF